MENIRIKYFTDKIDRLEYIDGKSDWKFLWRVMVPLAAPTLISITILKFMGTWNSYVWPNLVTNSDDFRLISNGLRGSSFSS